MAYGTVNADVIGTSVAGSNLGAGNASIMKNRLINGSMVIDQRYAGASVTPTSTSYWASYGYTLDRWCFNYSQASKISSQQNAGSVTPPPGFSNYLGATSLSAFSVGASDYVTVGQRIEGFNTADLNWGTANAKTVTLSFQVYSSLTGTFGGAVTNSANNRSYAFTYTISSANTWTTASVTIPGDTSGTWIGATNGVGIQLTFGLGVGSTYSGAAGSWTGSLLMSATGATSVVGTNGATFYITGVQLEVGSSATGYEYRQYGQELALCQRYYWQCVKVMGNPFATDTAYNPVLQFPITMRTTPTLASSSTFTVRTGSAGSPAISTGVTGISASPDAVWIYNASSNWTVSGTGNAVTLNGGFSAEL